MSKIDKIERSLEFPFPPARVWRAITQPQELCQWFSDHVTLTLEVGSEAVFEWEQLGRATGVVEAIVPNQTLAFRWRARGVPEAEAISATNSTLVAFTLEKINTGTRLTVSESGFSALPLNLRETIFEQNTIGWQHELAELVTYLSG